MRLVILIALIIAFGAVLLFGFLHLARGLFLKDFSHPPSMPGETANQRQVIRRETPSHSANPTA